MAERFVTQIGPGLAARVQGEGTKVLWLHGYTLDSSSWREMWRRLPGFCHVGLDLPGHGGSAPVGPHDNLHVLARRVADVCLEAADAVLARSPLVAANTVERPGVLGRLGFYTGRTLDHLGGLFT